MAVVKFTNSKGSLRKILNYVTQDEKTDAKLISGQNCMPESALDEMQTIKRLHGKDNGRQYIHIVQSFKPDESLTHEKAHKIGIKLAEYFKEYQVVIATHKDRTHIHNHLVLNSVSLTTGLKFQQSKEDMQTFKEFSDKLCREYRLSVIENKTRESVYKQGEYRSAVKGDSWKLKLSGTIDMAMEQSRSKAEFISNMQNLGYGVTWTASRKYITYTTPSGARCRDKSLHEDKYLKQNMEAYFDELQRIKGNQQTYGNTNETVHSHYNSDTAGTVGDVSRNGNNDRSTEFTGKESRRNDRSDKRIEDNGNTFGRTRETTAGSGENHRNSRRNFEKNPENAGYNRGNRNEVFSNRSNSSDSLVGIFAHISAVRRRPKQLSGKKFSRKSDSKQAQKEKAIEMVNSSGYDWEDDYDDEWEM